jgi:hypothetical protein
MTLRTLARAILLAITVCSAATAVAVDGTVVPVRTLQSPVLASLIGPSRVAATSSGRLFVVDRDRKLNMLTPRGEFMGVVAQHVWAVTTGAGKVFAASDSAELVTIDAQYGRVLGRVALGVSEGPVGLAYDARRNLIWMVFRTGTLEARRPDGGVVNQFPNTAVAGPGTSLVDVAIDPQADIVWVAKDRPSVGGMIFGLQAADGKKVKAIGVDGLGPVDMTGVLAVGSDGSIFVTDLLRGAVKVLDAAGAPLATIVVPPAGIGQPPQAAGLAFMLNGDLLVADLFGSRFDRFGYGVPLPVCPGDTDCDGMPDAWEVAHGLSPTDPRDALRDDDLDGLVNSEEYALGTNPSKADSDGDGYSDAWEIAHGFNPLDPNDHLPLVVASGATEFAPGIVALSASVARVAEPDKCTPVWTQTSGPAVALKNGATFSPTFVARKAQTYGFSVVASCAGVSSAAAAVAATVLNLAPIVDTARVTTVDAGGRVRLDARRSSDANGDAVAFAWKWGPVSDPSVLSVSSASTVSTRLPSVGAYRFKVTVTDPAGAAGEGVSTVVALGSNPVPVAAVVSPVSGEVGQPIALDASGSYRAADATFAWRQVAGPQVAVLDGGAPVAGFVPSEAGRYVFEVTVAQGGIAGPPALVEALVAVVGQALPVAVATAPAAAPVASVVTLDGTASASGSGQPLEYAWRQVSGPAAGLGSPRSSLASVYLFSPGSHEFELTVRDGAGVGRPSRVRVDARAPGQAIPVARVAAPETAAVGEMVRLDARGSTNAARFRWTQVGGPWVLLSDRSIESFRATDPGTYVFELEVEQGQARSAPVRVSVVVVDDGTGS